MIAASKQVGTLKGGLNRQRGKLIMRGLACEKSWLIQHLEEVGFQKIESRSFQVGSNRSLHDFVLAERAEA